MTMSILFYSFLNCFPQKLNSFFYTVVPLYYTLFVIGLFGVQLDTVRAIPQKDLN